MKETNISEIEKKYWAAELTEEEEETLHSVEVRPLLSQELQMMLGYFDSARQETSTRPVLVPQEKTKVISLEKASNWRKIAAAVAVLVLAGTLTTTYLADQTDGVTQDTYSDPDEALEEVIRTLTFASEKINQGYEATQIGIEETEIFNLFNL